MKYLSAIIFTAALVWSWNVIHSKSALSNETHTGIQQRLAQLIIDTVKAKKPAATEISVVKIWTEPVSDTEVRAIFHYSFKEPTEDGSFSVSQISGEGILDHQPDDGTGNDRWTLTKVTTNSDAVIFEDGLVVTAGGNTAEVTDAPNAEAVPVDPNAPMTSEQPATGVSVPVPGAPTYTPASSPTPVTH